MYVCSLCAEEDEDEEEVEEEEAFAGEKAFLTIQCNSLSLWPLDGCASSLSRFFPFSLMMQKMHGTCLTIGDVKLKAHF